MRIVTWNLWAFDRDRARRRERIVETLRTLEPDVCCLQEVRADGAEDQAATLARKLGLHPVRAGWSGTDWWRRRLGDDTAEVGSVVLSRWPASDVSPVVLPQPDGRDEGRAAVLARIAHPSGPVLVATTQLSSSPTDSVLRVRQVQALAAALVDARGPDDLVVVAGDLNAEEDSDEVRMLCGQKTAPAAEGLVLLDAWRFAPHDDPGWTWDRANPYVAATGEPGARIDYVLLAPLPSGRLPGVTSVGRAGTEVIDGVAPSDHAAVVVDLDLSPADA